MTTREPVNREGLVRAVVVGLVAIATVAVTGSADAVPVTVASVSLALTNGRPRR